MATAFRATILGLAFASLSLSTQGAGESPPNVLPRVIVVISDLHLGQGERTIGEYYPQEDFQWGEDFVTFLDAVHRAGGGHVTLVVAGDMFELWESMEDESDSFCRGDKPDFGCSEAEAQKRMVRIVGAHRIELQALGAFASRGANQVIIVPGNHDAAILFPSVWNLVKIAARPLRPTNFGLATAGRWISPDGNVVVEHGHQMDDANKFANWPIPMAQAPSGTQRLRSPFGERLVREFFDPLERKYPVVDNITGGGGLLYGIKREGFMGTSRVFTDFLKFISLDTSWRQFTEFLNEGPLRPPVWDVSKVRTSAVNFLGNALPPEDSMASLVREALATNDPNVSAALSAAAAETLHDMSDDEIRTICQSRYVAYLQSERDGVPPAQRPATCDRTEGDLGYLTQKTVQTLRGSLYCVTKYLSDVVEKLPEVNGREPITFVYGHTHAATRATRLGPHSHVVINSGAWQRLVSADTVAVMAKQKQWTSDQVLNQLKLRDLPACYSFVWIPLSLGKVGDAKLRYWALDKDVWKFKAVCPERESLAPE
jgi:hypothetical protein